MKSSPAPMYTRSGDGPSASELDCVDTAVKDYAGSEATILGENQDVIVIGAGLGGLSAAIHLARRGRRVSVLEKNYHAGGRMNVIRENGFTIDMGPTMLMMPEVIHDIFTACGKDCADYLPMRRLLPAYRILWPDGTALDMGVPLADLKQQIAAIAPEDVAGIERLFAAMRLKYENARHNFIERPFNSLRDMLSPTTLKGMAKALPLESVYSFVSRYLKSERLREAFSFQTLYLGMSPYDCPAIYALLPYIEKEFGVWYPTGGTGQLALAMERLLNELGGRVEYGTPVAEVIVEQGRAAGVRLANGSDVRANAVVCNVDAPAAYRDLISGGHRRKYTDDRLSKYEYGCSGYLLYLGVKDLSHNYQHNMIVLGDNYREVLNDTCHAGRLPDEPALHVCIPTITDPSLAPAGHDVVYILVPCANTLCDIDWEVEGPKLRERTLAKLETCGLPGLRDKIVFERSFTPPQFEELYGCYAGAAYGSLTPSFLQSACFRPRCKSEDVDALYFVGAGTHPGGGVPIVLTSGRLAAEAVEQCLQKTR